MNLTRPIDFGSCRGRGLVVIRDIEVGEVLFTESPLISCQFSWNKLYGYVCCDYCMCPIEDSQTNVRRLTNKNDLILPYQDEIFYCKEITHCQCCMTVYCSSHCYENAMKSYHSLMCSGQNDPVLDTLLANLDEVWRKYHYPPETNTVFLLVRLVSICLNYYANDNLQSFEKFFTILRSFVSGTTVSFHNGINPEVLYHKLLGEQFDSAIKETHKAFVDVINNLSLKASLSTGNHTTNVLEKSGLSNLLNEDTFRTCLCLIGRNAQGIATSSMSLWVERVEKMTLSDSENFKLFLDQLYDFADEHVGPFLDNEGVGLYEYQSLINHSCMPNAIVKFTGFNNCLSIEATKPISHNEEVLISYLDPCIQNRSRYYRRKYLASHYLFWCDCPKCVQDKLDGALSQTSEESDEESVTDENMETADN